MIAKFVRGAPLALYDIGVGLKSEWRTLRKLYPQLKVYGCEPHPATYQTLLRDGFPGPLLNVAIGEADGTATLFDIADDAKRASLLPLGDSERQIPTDVWTLDRFDREMGRQDRILLWMDIEGTELAALRGGTELLDSVIVPQRVGPILRNCIPFSPVTASCEPPTTTVTPRTRTRFTFTERNSDETI
jgi:FkbM family methyltransferase